MSTLGRLQLGLTIGQLNVRYTHMCRKLRTAVPGAVHVGGTLLPNASGNDLLERMLGPARLGIGG